MAKKKKVKKEVTYKSVSGLLEGIIYKDSGKGVDEMCLRCDTAKPDEGWTESAFMNRLLATSPHLFEKEK